MMLSARISEARGVFEGLAAMEADIRRATETMMRVLGAGGRILVCGNGGSAAEAQHFATELTGRYRRNRAPLPAMFLGGDASQITCIANDFDWDEIFARPLKAFAAQGDLLLCFSTSGSSPNIVAALRLANEIGIDSIAMLGKSGGEAARHARQALIVASDDTARIQEAHLFLVHCFCDEIDGIVVNRKAS
jgi:D-sedoheptulose 7-phosphate isomerase